MFADDQCVHAAERQTSATRSDPRADRPSQVPGGKETSVHTILTDFAARKSRGNTFHFRRVRRRGVWSCRRGSSGLLRREVGDARRDHVAFRARPDRELPFVPEIGAHAKRGHRYIDLGSEGEHPRAILGCELPLDVRTTTVWSSQARLDQTAQGNSSRIVRVTAEAVERRPPRLALTRRRARLGRPRPRSDRDRCSSPACRTSS
jgi:hypothetical protein